MSGHRTRLLESERHKRNPIQLVPKESRAAPLHTHLPQNV